VASRKWFKIENPNLIIESNEKRPVNFEIQVPENAELGGHYSVVFFEPQLPSYYFKSGQPKSIPVIGVLFLISVKSLTLEPISQEEKIEIVQFEIQKEKKENRMQVLADVFQAVSSIFNVDIKLFEKTPKNFLLKIKNSDIYHHRLDGKILIYNFFGRRVGETELKSLSILPGKTRLFPISVSSEIPENLKWMPASLAVFLSENTSLGKYKAVLELNEQNSKTKLSQDISFWTFPWKTILFEIILIPIIVLTRKRIVAAIKILFKKQ
jgi:hypothetical protein